MVNKSLCCLLAGEVQARVSVAATAAVRAAERAHSAAGARAEWSKQFPLRGVAPQLHLQLHQECQTHVHLAAMSSALLSAQEKYLQYFSHGWERNWPQQAETDCAKLPSTVWVEEEFRSSVAQHPLVSWDWQQETTLSCASWGKPPVTSRQAPLTDLGQTVRKLPSVEWFVGGIEYC